MSINWRKFLFLYTAHIAEQFKMHDLARDLRAAKVPVLDGGSGFRYAVEFSDNTVKLDSTTWFSLSFDNPPVFVNEGAVRAYAVMHVADFDIVDVAQRRFVAKVPDYLQITEEATR